MKTKSINIGLILRSILMVSAFTSLSLQGQAPECFFVHFDKSFYVSGETIWFKIYLIGAPNEANSKILHVDLVNHQNNLVSRQKLPIDSGCSFGSINLPVDASEGYYRFRTYTRYDLNFEPAIRYQAEIPVYSLDGEVVPTKQQVEESTDPSGVSGITIGTGRKTYAPRDSLSVSYSLDQPGVRPLSISIIPTELVIPNFDFYGQLTCPDLSPKPGPLLLPERALFVEGKLVNAATGEGITSRLLSVYFDQTSQLIRASARDGNLRVAVPDYWGPGIFQILNIDPYNPVIPELLPSKVALDERYLNPTPPPRTARVRNYLDQSMKRRKINELFDLYQQPDQAPAKVTVKIPDAVYYTDDFKQIYDFEQFINEAIQNVRVRESNGVKTVRLFNREQGRLFEDHPWYIVDGFLTFDEKAVLQIDYQDIDEVKLFSKTSTLEQYFQGFMLRSGVMEIVTRDVKYVRELKESPNVVEIMGFARPDNFINTINLNSGETTPDLRGTIYWSPQVTTDSLGRGKITVPLSDDTGSFAIVIMGTDNNRQPVVGYQTFEVKLNGPQ